MKKLLLAVIACLFAANVYAAVEGKWTGKVIEDNNKQVWFSSGGNNYSISDSAMMSELKKHMNQTVTLHGTLDESTKTFTKVAKLEPASTTSGSTTGSGAAAGSNTGTGAGSTH